MQNQDFNAWLTQLYLMGFLLPLWIAAGFADYFCHRASRLEETAGWKESLMHWAQLIEMAVPTLMALLLQINALVIGVMAIALVVHEATAWLDLHYAHQRREITPFEQMVHSFLEMLPLMGLSVVVLLHHEQALSLVGAGPADFGLQLKQPQLPPAYLVGLAVAIVAFILLPYGEELNRALRHRPPQENRS